MWKLALTTLLIAFFTTSCGEENANVDDSQKTPATRTEIASAPNKICPLLLGDVIPDLQLKSVFGDDVKLSSLMKGKKTALVFYRGGWCFYCNMHLGKLHEIEKKLLNMGWQIIAISSDLPKFAKETKNKHEMNYTLLSDATLQGARKFGLAYTVDPTILNNLKSNGIDLEEHTGADHHLLPVPAVFLVNPDMQIIFEYVNPNHKERLDPRLILSAASVYNGNMKEENKIAPQNPNAAKQKKPNRPANQN